MAKEVRIQNKLTREALSHIQQEFVESGVDIVLHHCGKAARVNRPEKKEGDEDNSFIVYYDQFRLGLHLPLCPEFGEVLKHYGIILAQLVPNSVASIMSFIIYLRRVKRPWSLETFHQHFYCRFLQGGYAQFSTTSILNIIGLENKVENWKSHFCRVTSPMDIDIPRVPSKETIANPLKVSLKGLPILSLDVRQYVKDRQLLKRMIFTEKYTELSAEEWEESDKALANLPKPKSPKKSEGKRKTRAKSPIVWEEEEEAQQVVEADRPSTSRAREESGEPLLLMEGAQERITPPPKRKRLVQGRLKDFGTRMGTATTSTAAAEVPENPEDIRVINRKITMDLKKGKAIVDLKKEWFPSSSGPDGVARSMGLILYSDNMKKKIEETPLASLLDQFASHQAAAWSMGGFFGLELEKEKKKSAFLGARVKKLERSLQMLARSVKEKHKRMEDAELEHQCQIQEMAAVLQDALREGLIQQEKEHKEKIEKMKAASAQDIRNGIALCLDQLSEANAVLPKWNDTDKILKLVVASADDLGEGEDSEKIESDEASTTIG